jgi:hypothetical protein
MTMFLIGPDGLVQVNEPSVAPCPECFGPATTLTQTHKMGCGMWSLPHNCKSETKTSSKTSPTDPTPTCLFPVPKRTYWCWRVEFRVWVKREIGGEGWTEWCPLHRSGLKQYYLTEKAATKALARMQLRGGIFFHETREYRIGRIERPDKRPARRR